MAAASLISHINFKTKLPCLTCSPLPSFCLLPLAFAPHFLAVHFWPRPRNRHNDIIYPYITYNHLAIRNNLFAGLAKQRSHAPPSSLSKKPIIDPTNMTTQRANNCVLWPCFLAKPELPLPLLLLLLFLLQYPLYPATLTKSQANVCYPCSVYLFIWPKQLGKQCATHLLILLICFVNTLHIVSGKSSAKSLPCDMCSFVGSFIK